MIDRKAPKCVKKTREGPREHEMSIRNRGHQNGVQQQQTADEAPKIITTNPERALKNQKEGQSTGKHRKIYSTDSRLHPSRENLAKWFRTGGKNQ